MKTLKLISIIIFFFFINVLSVYAVDKIPKNIKKYINNGGLLVTDSNNQVIYSYNSDKQFIPASTIKILTCYYLLSKLKSDFHFYTDIYIDDSSNICVSGYGDPLLVTEEIDSMALQIKSKIKSINNIYVDNSFFKYPVTISGKTETLKPYDAPNNALSANFNSVSVKYTKKNFHSTEKKTPLTDSIINYLKKIKFRSNSRVNLGSDEKLPPQYFGELLKYMLIKNKVGVKGEIINYNKDSVQNNFKFFIRYYNSDNLRNIVGKIQKFSNNFMTNQIFLFAGALENNPPADINKSIKAINKFLINYPILKNVIITEGSGLSLANKISCQELNYVLQLYSEYYDTLRERNGGRFKTGTLTNVYCIAGYYDSKNYGRVKISILLNQTKNNRYKILEKLQKNLDGNIK